VCALTENKIKDLTRMGKNRFRVLKYEMVRGAHEIRPNMAFFFVFGPYRTSLIF